MATMIVGIPLPVLSRPRPTHAAFIRPVWSTLASRGWYMKRQITEAPTSETASGMKMNDLAIFSFFERSASTATASPIAVEANTTVTTHHRLLLIVPRTTVNTAYSVNRMPASSGAMVELPSSTALPVRRRFTEPTATARARMTRPIQNSRLVNMFVQLLVSQLASSWNVST